MITALRVASDDGGVYAGDFKKCLSYCDFRERYIGKRLQHSGVVSCIENAGDNKLLVGTHEGALDLLDTRFMHDEDKLSAVCSYTTGIAGAGIGGIRMCPQNANMFACSVGSDVLIYYKETSAKRNPLVFSHQAHRTLVTDFSWHPSRNYMYTIGSVDIGDASCPGELQIWRPVDSVMYQL
ncbi:hypothetical protein GGI21_002386 [Coemansia aciculifera]|nr:hypothetical protein GGI21_002386 [Coemansia aciculifera]